MTFTEAAAQVLRLVGKPLHYKEITDVAIEKNLLSHVGKSPEVTMGARLAALVKKGDKENPLVRVKPGVFALRDWDDATIKEGLADRTPALERIAANEAAQAEAGGEEEQPSVVEAAPAPELPSQPGYPELSEDEEAPPPDAAELERAQMAAKATEFFAPEEDDDVPLFGAGAEEEAEEEDEEAGAREEREGGRRGGRRRRRRRGRGSEEKNGSGDGLPSYTVSDAPAEAAAEESKPAERAERGRRRDRGERREARGGHVDEVAGRSLADVAADLLAGFDKNGTVGLSKLADAAQRRGRLSGDAHHVQAALSAAMRADNLRAVAEGQRPRFRITDSRVGLTEWGLDGELARLERDLTSLADRYREASRRHLLKRLQELPPRALGELVMLLLARIGMEEVEVVKRSGAPGAELHLSGRTSGPTGGVQTAIIVRRDGREVGREQVTALRGALHHYGPAHAGWIITTGQVLSGAREEAAATGAAPCTLVDGLSLATLCERYGVGVIETRVSLPLADIELFDALRSG